MPRSSEWWAFAWFFCLLASYFLLRPIREAIGASGDTGSLSWLYTGTFVAMAVTNPLFAWIVTRLPPRRFLALTYRFFALNLLLFALAFEWLDGQARRHAGSVFFVWLSVFNLSVVTVLWGSLADAFSREQAKRTFGFIGAGGTLGAIVGSWVVQQTVLDLRWGRLLLVAVVLLEIATRCALRVANRLQAPDTPLRGTVQEGMRAVAASPYLRAISGYLLFFTVTSTFVYFTQSTLVRAAIADPAERTRFFAWSNFAYNSVTLLIQLLFTGHLLRKLGLTKSLGALPAVTVAGFALVAIAPEALLVAGFDVVRKASHFALSKTAQEVLFTVVDRVQKYKAKSFIDTVVYRGGDVGAAWLYHWTSTGRDLRQMCWFAALIGAGWLFLGAWLGRMHERIAARNPGSGSPPGA